MRAIAALSCQQRLTSPRAYAKRVPKISGAGLHKSGLLSYPKGISMVLVGSLDCPADDALMVFN